MNIDLTPILPLPVLLAFAAIILLFGFVSILRKNRSWWLRLPVALLLLIALFNPQISSTDTRPLKDIALIIVDQSSSQTLQKRQAQTQEALAYLRKETGLYNDLETRIVQINADAEEDRLGTRAIGPLKQALSAIDPKRFGGAVLISDGQIHDTKDLDGIIAPVHLLLTGSRKDQDRRIEIVDAPRYGLVGEPVKIRVRVFDNGHINPAAHVSLITPDGARQSLKQTDKDYLEATYTPQHAGPGVLMFETDFLENEISQENNHAALTIHGVRDRLRVLLVSGMPHQGQRTWRNILRSDPSVDLVHFTILRPSEKEDFTPLNELSLIAFPVRELFEDKLDDFDLIIFDRYYKHNVLSEHYFQNITNYVRKGGAVLVSSGPDFSGSKSLSQTRLGDILPVVPTGTILQNEPYRLKRSTIGKRHPITANLAGKEQEWGRWMRLIETQKTGGKVILQKADNTPVLIVNRTEKGRIAMLLSDHIWLWARGFDGGGPHSALVRNLVHWLMKEPDLEEEKLTLSGLEGGQLEVTRQTLSPTAPTVRLTFPNGESKTVQLEKEKEGKFSTRVGAPAPGIYRAHEGKYNAVITIGTLNPKEFIDPRASRTPLTPLLEKAGGGVHWLEDGQVQIKRTTAKASTQGKKWIGFRRNQAEAVVGVKSGPLIPGWIFVLLSSALIIWGWLRESR